jgi:hypothetical protein
MKIVEKKLPRKGHIFENPLGSGKSHVLQKNIYYMKNGPQSVWYKNSVEKIDGTGG